MTTQGLEEGRDPSALVSSVQASPYSPVTVRERFLISIFILFHIVGTLLWNMPDSYTRSKLLEYVRPYMIKTCLMQSWSMFAPEPGRVNNYMEARVIFLDGRQKVFPFSRESQLSFWPQLINERFRKFGESTWDPQEYRFLYPDVALWAARKMSYDPSNPPVKVDLMRRWCVIPEPLDGIRNSFNPIWQSDVIYSVDIDPEAQL